MLTRAVSSGFCGLGLFGVHYLFLQEDEPQLEPSPGEKDEDDNAASAAG